MPASRFFVDAEPLKRFPDFRRLWLGSAISQCGSQTSIVAIQFQVYLLTGSSLDVGLVALVQLGPSVLGSLLGGSIADSMDRRKLIIITQTAMATCSLLLALNAMSKHPQLWLIFVLAAINAGIAGCDSSARTAVMNTIVDRESLVSAATLRQLITQIATIIGPSIGGILIAEFSISAVYWVDFVSFGASLSAVVMLSAHPPRGGATKFGLRSVVEGFTFLKGRQVIQACFVADLNAMILGMPTALFPALGIHHFHGGSRTVGLLYAAPGIGAFIAASCSGWAARIRHQGQAVLIAVGLWGLAIAGFGLSTILWLGLVLLAFAGGADVISAVFRSAIIQAEAPDRLRGRLSSFQTAVVQGGPRLGNFEAGAAASLFGTQLSVITGGLGCVVGIALIAKLMPRFSHYQMQSSTTTDVASSNPDSTESPAT